MSDNPTPSSDLGNNSSGSSVNERLQNRLFDVIVIGGGIAGLSSAREIATKGYDTLLIEEGLLGSGTSNNSLRIIHGGLRYLSRLNFPQMIESLKDQSYLMREAPSLIKSLPCIIPLEKRGLLSKPFARTASFIYNQIAEVLVGSERISQTVDAEFIAKYVQILKDIAIYGGLLWYDARIRDPQKLHALIAHKLDREGGDILTRAKVTKIEKDGSLFKVTFIVDGSHREVISRVVVNACGYKISDIPLSNICISRKSIKWAKAFNVVLNQKFEDRFAIGFRAVSKRQYFIVPRGNHSVLGTAYLPFNPREDQLEVSPQEVQTFLEEPSRTLKKELTSFSIDLGVIPVKAISKDGSDVSFLGRSSIVDYGGYIEVITTKYSGFRSLGLRTLNVCKKYLR